MTAPTSTNRSTPDSRAAALAMFESQIPCMFSFQDPACRAMATWLGYFVHEENTTTCGTVEPMLLCDEHKHIVHQASQPFWRVWFATPPIPCSNCGTPVRLDRFEVIA